MFAIQSLRLPFPIINQTDLQDFEKQKTFGSFFRKLPSIQRIHTKQPHVVKVPYVKVWPYLFNTVITGWFIFEIQILSVETVRFVSVELD